MKILKITGGYPPAYAQGGTATAAHSLMKALKAQGADVAVLTLNINGKERLTPSKGFVDFDGIPVWYCKGYHNSILPYFSPEMNKVFDKIVGEFDIVLLDSSWTAYGVSISKKCYKRKIPYLVYSHGCVTPERLNLGGTVGKIKKILWWHLFDKKMYNKSAGGVAITNQEVLFLKKIGVKVGLHVITNGVDIQDIDISTAKKIVKDNFPKLLDKDYFLFLGRLHPVKGLDILLQAYRELSKIVKHNELPTLVIAGPDENGYIYKLKKIAKDLEIERDVNFVGMVQGILKISLLKLSKAYILPSRSDVRGIATLEAMALGIPVIISEHCQFDEVETENAGKVVKLTLKDFAKAMKWALDNPEELKLMAHRGRNLVRRDFTWDSVATETLNLCKQILREGDNKA